MSKLIYIEWKPYYSVGHEEIDLQHRQIIGIINELYDAMQLKQDQQVIKPLLDRLVEYTTTHFECEERVFQGSAYAGFEEHQSIHEVMKRKTVELRRDWQTVSGSTLLTFLKKWWIDHICGKDKDYSPYVQLASAGKSAVGM